MNEHSPITQHELETIERYLDNEMSASEQEDFIRSISEEPRFQQKINEVRALRDGIETASLKETLDDFHKEIPLAHSKVVHKPNIIERPRRNRTVYLAVAAVAIVLIGLWQFLASGDGTEALYAEHFTPDPGLPTTMSTSDEYSFYDGMVDYKMGDYATAITKWELLLPNKPTNDTLHYFLGVAKLASDHDAAAISHLENITSQTNSMFYRDGLFYLGMAHLKNNEVEKAKLLFQESGTEASDNVLRHLP